MLRGFTNSYTEGLTAQIVLFDKFLLQVSLSWVYRTCMREREREKERESARERERERKRKTERDRDCSKTLIQTVINC